MCWRRHRRPVMNRCQEDYRTAISFASSKGRSQLMSALTPRQRRIHLHSRCVKAELENARLCTLAPFNRKAKRHPLGNSGRSLCSQKPTRASRRGTGHNEPARVEQRGGTGAAAIRYKARGKAPNSKIHTAKRDHALALVKESDADIGPRTCTGR